MKLAHTLVILLFSLTCIQGSAQYSRYYYLDTLQDNGIESPVHNKYKGKILWDDFEHYNDDVEPTDSILKFEVNANVSAHIFLSRSLRYHYHTYANDTSLKSSDWDYTRYKSDQKYISEEYAGTFSGYYVFVLTCDGDTVASWKSSVNKARFKSETVHNFYVLSDRLDDIQSKDEFRPIHSYIRKNKKLGEFTIRLDMDAGKLKCNSVKDIGPAPMATGKFRLSVSEEQLKELLSYKDASYRREFPDIDRGNRKEWMVKQK